MHELVREIAETIHRESDTTARALLVGGYVRDRLLGEESKDLDVEVFGLELDDLKAVLHRYGEVIEIGRAFGVLRVKGLDVDFSLPRRDSKIGKGHRGFDVQTDPSLTFEQAARRRDLTINSIGYDPLTGEYLDPFGGREDLAAGILRATDAERFSEDPLRGIRVAQLAARLQMQPDEELMRLCEVLDLSEVSPERVYAEFEKLLLKGRRPSLGFEFLRKTGLVNYFPQLHELIDVEQDPQWHPEGDVWVHTMMVIDEAAGLRTGERLRDLVLMYAALCHDFGKPFTTTKQGDRVRSLAHDVQGVEPTRAFLQQLRAPLDLTEQVEVLVRYHLAPSMFVSNQAGARGYRRLARKLQAAGVDMQLLCDVAKADHFGRTTDEALRRVFPALDQFLTDAAKYLEEGRAPKDLVQGRHLVAKGLSPGPQFREILDSCRELQDDGVWEDAEALLSAVLARREGGHV